MTSKLHSLVSWTETSNPTSMNSIKEPLKPVTLTSTSGHVLPFGPKYRGLNTGATEDMDEDKPQNQNLLHGAPKSTRKTIIKGVPRNVLRGDQKLHFQPKGDLDATEMHATQGPLYKRKQTEEETAGLWYREHWSRPTPQQQGGLYSAAHCPLRDREESSGLRKERHARATDVATAVKKRKAEPSLDQCKERLHITRGDHIQSEDSLSSETESYEVLRKCCRCAEDKREQKLLRMEKMVTALQHEMMCLKRKVQRLEATPLHEDPLPHPYLIPELFNGHTREQLREAIRFDQKISTACKTLLHKLFSSDYIQSHSITGRRGNTFRQAKPMMDERCVKVIRVLLKHKFGDHLSDTVITEKIQNVQKALRQKFKAEKALDSSPGRHVLSQY